MSEPTDTELPAVAPNDSAAAEARAQELDHNAAVVDDVSADLYQVLARAVRLRAAGDLLPAFEAAVAKAMAGGADERSATVLAVSAMMLHVAKDAQVRLQQLAQAMRVNAGRERGRADVLRDIEAAKADQPPAKLVSLPMEPE